MSTVGAREIARRAGSVALLVLAPLLVLGGLEGHLGHRPGQSETPVFTDARHAGEADHWDAARSSRVSRCLACLVPTQPLEPAQAGAFGLVRPASGSLSANPPGDPADPGARCSRRPRAPPLIELS